MTTMPLCIDCQQYRQHLPHAATMRPSASAIRVRLFLESHLLDLNHRHVICQYHLLGVPVVNPRHTIKSFPRTFYFLVFSKPTSNAKFCLGFCLFAIMPIHDTFGHSFWKSYRKPSKNIPQPSSFFFWSLGSGLK